MNDPRYPLGRFQLPSSFDSNVLSDLIREIDLTPGNLRVAVSGLPDRRLDRSYRQGGWTIRQVVHHLADSHMNAYVRCKLAMTEDRPTVKTYREDRWAELPDARSADISPSLELLDGLHRRWVIFFRSLEASDFQRSLDHPELGRMSLEMILALYAWHGRHHVAHINGLRQREGW